MGIEPTTTAWKAVVLPLNYTRVSGIVHNTSIDLECLFLCQPFPGSRVRRGNSQPFQRSVARGCGFTTKLHPHFRHSPYHKYRFGMPLPLLAVSGELGASRQLAAFRRGIARSPQKRAIYENGVGKTGFEPATPTSRTWCSAKLSYFPKFEPRLKAGLHKKRAREESNP